MDKSSVDEGNLETVDYQDDCRKRVVAANTGCNRACYQRGRHGRRAAGPVTGVR